MKRTYRNLNHKIEIISGYTLNPTLTHETHSELVKIWGWACECGEKSTTVFYSKESAELDSQFHQP